MSAAENRASARQAARKPQEQSAAAPSPFPPIADYAFLSNCHTGALVAPDGSIDWLCVPRFDSPSVFGSLLDRQAGSFRFGPFGINHPTTRIYEPGTNVLVTTWKSPSGWIVVRDALTIGPRDHEDKITPHTRPPADDDADHLLVRTVLCLEGSVEVELICEPAFDYGRVSAEWAAVDGDRHVSRRDRCRTDNPPPLGSRSWGSRATAFGRTTSWVRATGRIVRSPGPKDSPHRRTPTRPRLELQPQLATGVPGSEEPAFPTTTTASPIERSALTIKGLTFMPTGAAVAALTTSLPETPGGERNWDYRYTWMRDATFMLQALHWLNLDWEADEFMQFVADVKPTEDGSLQIMYGIDGRRELPEIDAGRPLWLCRCASGSRGQCRLQSAPKRRLRRRPRTRSCSTPGGTSACRAGSGRSSSRRRSAPPVSGATPTRASGRLAASHSITCPPN